MSNKARHFDYSPDEYITGVAGRLRADEQGVYWMICSLIMSEGGPISYDERRLAMLCMERPSAIRRVVDRLVDLNKLTRSDGKLNAPDLAETMERAVRSMRRLHPDDWAVLRRIVFQRDDFTCGYCGQRGGSLECDHIIPVSRGGNNNEDNLITACRPCNRSKGAMLPEEWRQ